VQSSPIYNEFVFVSQRKILQTRGLPQQVMHLPCHRDTGRKDQVPPDVSGASQNVQEVGDPIPLTMRLFGGPQKKKKLTRGLPQQVTHLPCHHDTERLDRAPPDISGTSQNLQGARDLMNCHATSTMRLFWGPHQEKLLARGLPQHAMQLPCHRTLGGRIGCLLTYLAKARTYRICAV
jgi:hypothetical protein